MTEFLMLLVMAYAVAYEIPSGLLLAVVQVESNFDPNATHINENGTIDRGLMQLNSSWYNDPEWNVPEVNLRAGAKYLHELRGKSQNWWQAVLMYNCGESRIQAVPMSSVKYANKVFAVWEANDPQFAIYSRR